MKEVKALLESSVVPQELCDDKSYRFVHVFYPDIAEDEIRVGFFNDEAESMRTLSNAGIDEETDELLRTDQELHTINLNKVEVNAEQAASTAKEGINKPLKRVMAVLQRRAEHHEWTVTVITTNFEATTVKINGETGEELSRKTSNMLNWVKTE